MFKWATMCTRLVICIKHAQPCPYKDFAHYFSHTRSCTYAYLRRYTKKSRRWWNIFKMKYMSKIHPEYMIFLRICVASVVPTFFFFCKFRIHLSTTVNVNHYSWKSLYADFMHQFVAHLKPNDWTRDAKNKVAVAV